MFLFFSQSWTFVLKVLFFSVWAPAAHFCLHFLSSFSFLLKHSDLSDLRHTEIHGHTSIPLWRFLLWHVSARSFWIPVCSKLNGCFIFFCFERTWKLEHEDPADLKETVWNQESRAQVWPSLRWRSDGCLTTVCTSWDSIFLFERRRCWSWRKTLLKELKMSQGWGRWGRSQGGYVTFTCVSAPPPAGHNLKAQLYDSLRRLCKEV